MSEHESAAQSQQPGSETGRVGQTRTWWCPLFARLVRWHFEPRYLVHDELNVGQTPLRLDVALLQASDAELPQRAHREMPVAERLRGLSAEDVLKGLSSEVLSRLKALLQGKENRPSQGSEK